MAVYQHVVWHGFDCTSIELRGSVKASHVAVLSKLTYILITDLSSVVLNVC